MLPGSYFTSPGNEKRTVKQSARRKKGVRHMRKFKRKRRKERQEEGIKCSRERRSYSRLLSPFHLQLPLYFPEPSPGTQTPLSTSASTTSSSRGILPPDIPAPEACIGATAAESRGPWGPLSHTQSCLAQLYGQIQNKDKTSSSCSAPLRALALGHDTDAPEGSHTHHRRPPSSWETGIILLGVKSFID